MKRNFGVLQTAALYYPVPSFYRLTSFHRTLPVDVQQTVNVRTMFRLPGVARWQCCADTRRRGRAGYGRWRRPVSSTWWRHHKARVLIRRSIHHCCQNDQPHKCCIAHLF